MKTAHEQGIMDGKWAATKAVLPAFPTLNFLLEQGYSLQESRDYMAGFRFSFSLWSK